MLKHASFPSIAVLHAKGNTILRRVLIKCMHAGCPTVLQYECRFLLVSAALQAQQRQASQQTRGIPPLVQSAVLTDRRHILTKDAEGQVELWDIATGAVQEQYGKVGYSCCMPLFSSTCDSLGLPFVCDLRA